jgi:hypothetical protein
LEHSDDVYVGFHHLHGSNFASITTYYYVPDDLGTNSTEQGTNVCSLRDTWPGGAWHPPVISSTIIEDGPVMVQLWRVYRIENDDFP